MESKQQKEADTPVGLSLEDMEDVWKRFDEFKGIVVKTAEEIGKERELEIEQWEQEQERWQMERHAQEEGFEYI